MKLRILILVLLLVPFTVASMDVSIIINENNIVTEDFTVYINADQSYDSFEFSSLEKPLSVIYEGNHDINLEDNYVRDQYIDYRGYLKMQIFGDHRDSWFNYFTIFHNFEYLDY